jgi:hypothetical protein
MVGAAALCHLAGLSLGQIAAAIDQIDRHDMKELLVLFCNVALVNPTFLELPIRTLPPDFLLTFCNVLPEECATSAAVMKWAPDAQASVCELIPRICDLLLAEPISRKWLNIYEKVVTTTDAKAPLIPLFGRLCECLEVRETWPFLIGIGDYLRHRDTSYGDPDCLEFLSGILQLLTDLVMRDVALAERASLWTILFGCWSDFWFATERVSAACELINLFCGDLEHLVPAIALHGCFGTVAHFLTKERSPPDIGALRYDILERLVWLINTGELGESVMASVHEKLVRRLMVDAEAAAQFVRRLDLSSGTFFIATSLNPLEVPDLCRGLLNALIEMDVTVPYCNLTFLHWVVHQEFAADFLPLIIPHVIGLIGEIPRLPVALLKACAFFHKDRILPIYAELRDAFFPRLYEFPLCDLGSLIRMFWVLAAEQDDPSDDLNSLG